MLDLVMALFFAGLMILCGVSGVACWRADPDAGLAGDCLLGFIGFGAMAISILAIR